MSTPGYNKNGNQWFYVFDPNSYRKNIKLQPHFRKLATDRVVTNCMVPRSTTHRMFFISQWNTKEFDQVWLKSSIPRPLLKCLVILWNRSFCIPSWPFSSSRKSMHHSTALRAQSKIFSTGWRKIFRNWSSYLKTIRSSYSPESCLETVCAFMWQWIVLCENQGLFTYCVAFRAKKTSPKKTIRYPFSNDTHNQLHH